MLCQLSQDLHLWVQTLQKKQKNKCVKRIAFNFTCTKKKRKIGYYLSEGTPWQSESLTEVHAAPEKK